jgi:hypothetical protein
MIDQDNLYRLPKGMIAFGGIFEAGMGLIILLWGDVIVSFANEMHTVPNYRLY